LRPAPTSSPTSWPNGSSDQCENRTRDEVRRILEREAAPIWGPPRIAEIGRRARSWSSPMPSPTGCTLICIVCSAGPWGLKRANTGFQGAMDMIVEGLVQVFFRTPGAHQMGQRRGATLRRSTIALAIGPSSKPCRPRLTRSLPWRGRCAPSS
jgi:hypothetical protein